MSAAQQATLYRIRKFCDAKGMALSRFGREAMADPGLVSDLRNGRVLRERSAAKIVAYMAKGGTA